MTTLRTRSGPGPCPVTLGIQFESTGTALLAANAASLGNTSELDEVLNLRDYTFDAAGQLESVAAGGNTVRFFYEPTGELQQAIRGARWGAVSLYYDGRRYLAKAESQAGGTVESAYSSAGLLMSLLRSGFKADVPERTNILYFAGRPIGIWSKLGTQTATLKTLTTDHLGAPIFALNSAGSAHWYGGFEPFGRDWQEGSANDALTKGIPLRLPGQWDDPAWTEATLGADIFYNVHRWYEPQTGRYTKPDSFDRVAPRNTFSYAASNSLRFADPLGLFEIDPSCDCVPERLPRDSVQKAIGEARKYFNSPGCQKVLESYPQVKDCLGPRFGPDEIGKGPKITCKDDRMDHNYCAESKFKGPSDPGVINLIPGHVGCPRYEPRLGLGQTLFHETVHSCGFYAAKDTDPDLIAIVSGCTGAP